MRSYSNAKVKVLPALTGSVNHLESRPMSLTIPAIPFNQRRTQMYIAAIPVDFLERFSVDIWDPKNVMGHRGYQRRPEEKLS